MAEQWDQQTGESGEAYTAFKTFRDLGPGRTVLAAYRARKGHAKGTQGAQVSGRWKRWTKEHRWAERAQAWDARGAQVQQAAAETVIATVAADRAARAIEHQEQEFRLKARLYDTINSMLDVALVKRKVVTTEDGKRVEVSEPAKWDFGTLAKLAQTFSLLGRGSLNMPLKVDAKETSEAPYFESSGEQESALAPGAVPQMPADSAAKPELGVSVIGPAGEGLRQPKKARPPHGPGNV